MNEPEAEELTPTMAAQFRFQTGHQIGELARKQFQEGIMVEDTKDFGAWLSNTLEAIKNGHDVIFEAAFSNDSLFTAVDILKKEGDGWAIIEVKSGLSIKDQHIDDVVYQKYLLSELGLKIKSCQVMHLNRECQYPNLENFLITTDITEIVDQRLGLIEAELSQQINSLSGSCPSIKPGKHCNKPLTNAPLLRSL